VHDHYLTGAFGHDLGLAGIYLSFGAYFKTWGVPFDYIKMKSFCDTGCEEYPPIEIPFNVEDGRYHSVCLSWDPTNFSLTITVDERFTTSVNGIDLEAILNGSEVFWGFSAGTGDQVNLQQVCIRDVIVN
jgi:Bacterial lectin